MSWRRNVRGSYMWTSNWYGYHLCSYDMMRLEPTCYACKRLLTMRRHLCRVLIRNLSALFNGETLYSTFTATAASNQSSYSPENRKRNYVLFWTAKKYFTKLRKVRVDENKSEVLSSLAEKLSVHRFLVLQPSLTEFIISTVETNLDRLAPCTH